MEWSLEAKDRLEKVPSFARGMVKRIYTDYARERAIAVLGSLVRVNGNSQRDVVLNEPMHRESLSPEYHSHADLEYQRPIDVLKR